MPLSYFILQHLRSWYRAGFTKIKSRNSSRFHFVPVARKDFVVVNLDGVFLEDIPDIKFPIVVSAAKGDFSI
jgi:hypothetical protein